MEINDLSKWMEESDHSKPWLARELKVDVRTVQNWFSIGEVPQKHHKRIAELIEMESEILHTVKIKLRNPHFKKANKNADAKNMPLDEYCSRAVIDNL